MQSAEGALCRRFEHHRVAGDQRRRYLGDGQVDRIVKGGDSQHNAEGHAHRETDLGARVAGEGIAQQRLSVQTLALLGGKADEIGRAQHLVAAILAVLGNLARENRGQRVDMVLQEVGSTI